MINTNNVPADLVVAIELLTHIWKEHNIPTGTIVGGFMTIETAQLHAQRQVDRLLTQLEAAGIHVERKSEEAQ